MPRQAFSLAIILSLLAVMILGALTFRNASLVSPTESRLEQASAVRQSALEMLSAIKDSETGQHGFLITASQDYLKPYYLGLAEVDAQLSRLKALLAHEPDQEPLIQMLDALVTEKRAEVTKTVDIRRTVEGEAGYQQARQVVMTDRGRVTMIGIRDCVQQLLTEEDRITDELRESSDRRARNSKMMILIGSVMAMGLLAAAAFMAQLDRKKRDEAEGKLESVAAELAAIVDSVQDGIVAFDDQLCVRKMNPTAAAIHQCHAASVVGESILSFLPSRVHDRVAKFIRDFVLSTEESRSFHGGVALRADGTEFYCKGQLTRSIVGGRPFTTVLFHDLSEQKAGKLAVSERNALLDQSRDAIYVCDVQDQITYWNPAAATLYGISAEQAVGSNVADLLFASNKSQWQDGRKRLLADGVYSTELLQHSFEIGRDLIVDHRRSLIRADDNTPLAQLVIEIDVTERRKSQLHERRSQRLESIGTLAGGIAHDLNNVLTPILMGGKLLMRSEENRERLADSIVASAERGGQMIRKLLSFAGGDSGAYDRIDIQVILEETYSILLHTLPKGIELHMDIDRGIQSVHGDATELAQVMMNLAINARDAMPNGGRLDIRVEEFDVDQRRADRSQSLTPGKHLMIAVTDTGTGIHSEIIEQIFDPFFTTKEQGKGTGLGLATTLGIIQSHRGDIDVYSEPGVGTTFTLLIPYLPVESRITSPEPSDNEDVARGNGEVILLVDDEPLILEAAHVALEANGYRVKVASGGTEAVSIFQYQGDTIDLAVVDIMMPGMDGLQTMSALRMLNPEINILACSGYRRRDSELGLGDTANAFLAKPYSDRQLLLAVHRILATPVHAINKEIECGKTANR